MYKIIVTFYYSFSDPVQSTSSFSTYDLDDVKESVRQGVTKVAGRLGSLANGFMSQIQVCFRLCHVFNSFFICNKKCL